AGHVGPVLRRDRDLSAPRIGPPRGVVLGFVERFTRLRFVLVWARVQPERNPLWCVQKGRREGQYDCRATQPLTDFVGTIPGRLISSGGMGLAGAGGGGRRGNRTPAGGICPRWPLGSEESYHVVPPHCVRAGWPRGRYAARRRPRPDAQGG